MEFITILLGSLVAIATAYIGFLKGQKHIKCESGCMKMETDASSPVSKNNNNNLGIEQK